MIGSVVDKVMRASPVPVLAVPEKGGGRIGKEGMPDADDEADVDEKPVDEVTDESTEEAPGDATAE